MKKVRLSFLGLLFCLFLPVKAASYINIKGTDNRIDTLECRVIGPGIEYVRFFLPEYPLSVYLLKVDLNNAYNKVETFQAQTQLGKTEAMTAAYGRLDAPGHRTIAGVNANFWIVSGQGQPNELLGVPHSGSMRNGEMLTEPNGWNRGRGATEEERMQDIGFAMLDEAKKMWIDDVNFNGIVRIHNAGEFPIAEVNRTRAPNELVLFNQYLGKNIPTRTDNDGTEVFVKPADGAKWGVNKDIECVVTRVIKNKGANLPEEGEYVLSGNGTAQTFLNHLSEGSKVVLNLGIATRKDNDRPAVDQMVTGNALVMKNGVLTPRNYNEDYNTQLYPRTGIGSSADGKTLYLIVIDKRGASKGANTETMCEILKAYGAVSATSMDGGGSAQMMVEGAIVNQPADGRERPVANGWFLYQNAPEDSKITGLMFEDFKIELPAYSSYKPVVFGYNQYGVLVDKHVEGYTLTCSSGIGTVAADGTFMASGISGTGVLTAEYNGVSVSKPVSVVSGKVAIRLDSVLIDNRRDYSIEVLSSTASGETRLIDPAGLNWTVEDDEICVVENGVVKGLKTGRTKLTGDLDGVHDEILVLVEIPETSPRTEDRMIVSEWTLNASSFLNAELNELNRPSAWEHGSVVNFTGFSGRAPSVKLQKDVRLFGLPDTVRVTLNIGNLKIDRALLYLYANNGDNDRSREFKVFEQEHDFSLDIPVSDLFDTSDRGIYPLIFSQMQFHLSAAEMVKNSPYSLAVKGVECIYSGFGSGSGVESVSSSPVLVYPNPLVGEKFYVRLDSSSPVDAQLYGLSGQRVFSGRYLVNEDGLAEIPAKDLPQGTYLLRLYQDERVYAVKIVK